MLRSLVPRAYGRGLRAGSKALRQATRPAAARSFATAAEGERVRQVLQPGQSFFAPRTSS